MLELDGSPARLQGDVVYGAEMGVQARPDHHPGPAAVLDYAKFRSILLIPEYADLIAFSGHLGGSVRPSAASLPAGCLP